VTILGGAARTAAQAAAYLGISPAQIANSLVFTARAARAPAEPLLVLTAGAHRVDTIKVADLLELAELGRADAELVRKRTGFVIGGVAPVGHTPRCGLSSTSPSPATTPSGPPPATPTPPIRATASGLQNRVVLLQPADLGLARLDLDQLLGGGAVSLAAVDLGLDHPATHRLLADTELLGHSCRGGRQRGNSPTWSVTRRTAPSTLHRSSWAWCSSSWTQTGAASNLGRFITALVYLDAFLPENGDSCWTMTNDEQRQWYATGCARTGYGVEPLPFFSNRARP